jgi:hypothetical protein
MRVFGPIVEPFMLSMLHTTQDCPLGCRIARELIGNEHTRNILTPFEQFAKKLLGRLPVPPALHQDIQHMPLLINCTPEVVKFAVDFEKYLIEMPLVAGLWSAASQLIGRVLPESMTPLTDCLIGEYNRDYQDLLIGRPGMQPNTKVV